MGGHGLTTHTYLGVEAIDPYITIQANGTHAIARRMDDEIETITFPQVSSYICHLKVLMWATRDVITGTLYRISDFETPIYNYKMETVFATKAFVFKYPYDMFSVESSSDTSCSRTVQFIRAQV